MAGFPNPSGFRRVQGRDRPRNRKVDPVKIEAALSSMLKKYGLDRELAKYKFVLHWPEIVGEEISKHATPECIKNGNLVVRVRNSAWAQELSFQRGVILSRLAAFADTAEPIKDVLFYVAGR